MVKEHKKEILMLVLVLLFIVVILGVSYAAFSYSGLGSKVNTITTGFITMTYEESDNTISLNGALPTTDKTGKVRLTNGEYFDFTVSSEITGNVNINYEISAKDVTDSSAKKIDGKYIKLYLTRLTDNGEEELMAPEVYNEETSANDYTGRPAEEMSLFTSSMNSSESNRYRLRMWVSEDYNPQGDGGNLEFSVKINVYGQDRVAEEVSTVLLNNIPKENQYDDGVDTFITGEDPNNYIWYSGKLWRAVSVNNEAKTTKLVTQWNISTINYNDSGSTSFEGSYMEEWLNDTTVDGFLGNLRDYDNFIVTDAKWNATETTTTTKPEDTTLVTDAVGLLNAYEYTMSYNGTDYSNGYLNNELYWWLITPFDSANVRYVYRSGAVTRDTSSNARGIRPSINLKYNVEIVDGDGTADNPYRLDGDNDTDLSGTLLSSRYSGEYIKFGNDENNLYRIVSHENETGTKVTSDEPLRSSGTFIISALGDVNYSNTTTMGTYLNSEYLTNYVDSQYSEMIEDSTIWYLGTVGSGVSYKLAKYIDENETTTTSSTTVAKVGLLRMGELMAGQFDIYVNNISYWILSPYSTSYGRNIQNYGGTGANNYLDEYAIKPSINLKSNVVITGGDGTKERPFTLALQ